MRVMLPLLFALTWSAHAQEPDWRRFTPYNAMQGPGMSVLVLHQGRLVAARGFGTASIPTGRINTAQTAFNLASVSKAFTAMCIMLLEERGQLRSEDFVGRILPNLPAWGNTIRVRDFVHHTGGLPEYFDLCNRPGHNVTNEEILEWARTQEPMFPPGTGYTYSNTGYALLANIIERVSGQSFVNFVQREIFDRLGMSNSYVFHETVEIRNRAYGYALWPNFDPQDEHVCNVVFGDGGVYTSVTDYIRWIEALETPGRLLSEAALRRYFTSGRANDGREVGYAYGWRLDTYMGMPAIFHGGAWVGFRSSATWFPTLRLWTLFLSNSAGVDMAGTDNDLLRPYLPHESVARREAGHTNRTSLTTTRMLAERYL